MARSIAQIHAMFAKLRAGGGYAGKTYRQAIRHPANWHDVPMGSPAHVVARAEAIKGQFKSKDQKVASRKVIRTSQALNRKISKISSAQGVAEIHRKRIVAQTKRMPAAMRGVMGDYR